MGLLCVPLFAIGVAPDIVLTPVSTEVKAVVGQAEEEPGGFGENDAYAQAFGLMYMALLGGILVHWIRWVNLTLGTVGVVFAFCMAVFVRYGGKRQAWVFGMRI